MPEVFVSIGSNIDPEVNVRAAVDALREHFGSLNLSRVYRSRAVGFDGPDFYNLVAGFETARNAQAVQSVLRDIELACGRYRSGPKFSSRTLDLDLLLYGDMVCQADGVELPRGEITEHAFVLGPLAEIAGDQIHPVLEKTIAQLWRDFVKDDREIEPVALSPLS